MPLHSNQSYHFIVNTLRTVFPLFLFKGFLIDYDSTDMKNATDNRTTTVSHERPVTAGMLFPLIFGHDRYVSCSNSDIYKGWENGRLIPFSNTTAIASSEYFE